MSRQLPAQFATAAGAAICACLCVVALAAVLADLAARRPASLMQAWERDGRLGDHELRQAMLTRLRTAAAAMPWSASYRVQLAHFYTWHAHAQPPISAQRRLYLERARGQLEAALRRRPAWGYGWALLAENQVLANGPGPAAGALLTRALELGPYEPVTLRKIALLGMAAWGHLDADARRAVRTAVDRALRIDAQPAALVRAAVGLGWSRELEPLLAQPEARAAYRALAQTHGR